MEQLRSPEPASGTARPKPYPHAWPFPGPQLSSSPAASPRLQAGGLRPLAWGPGLLGQSSSPARDQVEECSLLPPEVPSGGRRPALRALWPQALAQTARAGDVYLTEPSPLAQCIWSYVCRRP